MAGRRTPAGPFTKQHIGVVDIGSNSIRLVVFDRLSRAPLPLFNEKILSGLGRGLGETGRLSEEGVVSALDNLTRFAALAHAMGLRHLGVLATAAVRDAENGREFVDAVRARSGLKPRILSGAEEAEMSAAGVTAGIPDAHGVMGDLGGGSLELVRLNRGRSGPHATLPFGPLRLREALDNDGKGRVRDVIDEALHGLGWLRSAKGRAFYAVGGAWRGIARLHMDHVGYPLRVIQNYALSLEAAEEFIGLLAGMGRESLLRIGRVPRKRLEGLPVAALVLGRVLREMRPSELVFSAFGLREGYVHQRLAPAQRAKDPLLDACEAVAARHPRFDLDGAALDTWIAPLFRKSPAAFRRLRLATCILADFAWTEHPDYRADIAFRRTLHMPLSAIDHAGRAFLAMALYTRYDGTQGSDLTRPAWRLLDETQLSEAWRVGLALRLAFSLSAGAKGILRRTSIEGDGGKLRLRLPNALRALAAETVERRLAALADALDKKATIEFGRG
jgi:exopolyphosphatase / guanosine-5'-triphosphate,3'-diphosphate pyrophosphatase